MRWFAALFLLVVACAGPGGGEIPSPPAEETPSEPTPEQVPGVEQPTPDPNGCADLFAANRLPSYELTLAPADLAALEADFIAGRKEYHPGVLRVGGDVRDVSVRLKGNPSFSWFGDKMQFVISFNEVDPDQRFHGLRRIVLDAPWYDSTLLRDRLSWYVLRQAEDLPAACANNATLVLNGSFYGVFAHLESFDRELQERIWGADGAVGTLWKYGSEPETNAETADWGRIAQLWGAFDLSTLEQLGDVSQWVRAWAAEAVLGDDDGFLCCGHNFFVFDHPTRGFLWAPWDLDDTLEIQPYDSDPITGYGHGLFAQPLVQIVLADPSYHAAYVDEIAALATLLDPPTLSASLMTWGAQIDPAVAADTRRTWGDAERAETMERIGHWLLARRAFLDRWVRCERGDDADLDGDGLGACSDPDDDTPLAAEGCNGRDDDHDGLIDEGAGCDDCAHHDVGPWHGLFCSEPRTWEEASAHCASLGAVLAPAPVGDRTIPTWFWTWPDTQPWWLASQGAGWCDAWDEGSFSVTLADCAELHPSICELP